MDSELHFLQNIVLYTSLDWLWQDRKDVYISGGSLNIYYSCHQQESNDFQPPDFFVVLNTERKLRRHWVAWDEMGVYPYVIVELLTPSTAESIKTDKKRFYEDIFRAPDFFWFDPYTKEFAGFQMNGSKYEPLEPNEKGHLWSQQLGLFLGVHHGLLRFFTETGELVLIPEEIARSEIQQRKLAEERVEKLATKLRELGIDPDTI